MAKTSAVEAINEFPVEEWNRFTVADGQWLNDKDIVPLSSRDQKLAEIIDELDGTFSENISTLETDVKDITDYVNDHKEEWGANKFNAGVGIDPVALTASKIIKINTDGSALGTMAFAEGSQTLASGNYSHAEGNITTAEGEQSHAEGGGTNAIGAQAHAEGGGTIASGASSHSEGAGTRAIGDSSHAEGGSTSAIGYGSHAEGGSTIASGSQSHAEGGGTSAIGAQAHAEGGGTYAGDYSHAGGLNSSADSASISYNQSSAYYDSFAFDRSIATNAVDLYRPQPGWRTTNRPIYFTTAEIPTGVAYDMINQISDNSSCSGNVAYAQSSAIGGAIAIKGSIAVKGSVAFKSSTALWQGFAANGAYAENGGLALHRAFATEGGVAFGEGSVAGAECIALGRYNLTTAAGGGDNDIYKSFVIGNGKSNAERNDALVIYRSFTGDPSTTTYVSARDFVAYNGKKLSECGQGGGEGTSKWTGEIYTDGDFTNPQMQFQFDELVQAYQSNKILEIKVHSPGSISNEESFATFISHSSAQRIHDIYI